MVKNFLLKHKFKLLFIVLFAGWFYFLIPSPLFQLPKSTVVYSANGNLMGARIADDGQWRFPAEDSVPFKFTRLITLFEDEYFYYHPGVNPISMGKALWSNVRKMRVKRGGSTLTMQVARMARGNNSRNIWNKGIETFCAVRIEAAYSKEEILNLYASNAPFGGNVVGLSAASWRYYGREPSQLSWGEMATIAVLPNAPSLIFPGKNQARLLKKRNQLLHKLMTAGDLTNEDYELAIAEPLPGKPRELPDIAPHLIGFFEKNGQKGERITSALNYELQARIYKQLKRFQTAYSLNEVHNLAAIVVEVKSGKVLSYIGNIAGKAKEKGEDVDIIQSARSSGSILKPFLYAAAVDEGMKLPDALVNDIPYTFAGYSPQNYELSYDGVVPMSHALTRSLNIPFVLLLKEYGVQRFLDKLNAIGFSSLNRTSNNYGLSLILGGGEVKLMDLASSYRKMAYDLQIQSRPAQSLLFAIAQANNAPSKKTANYSQSAIWHTFETMSNVVRPRSEDGWQQFLGGRKVAWKTGTSFGHRDAWAVGVTPEYVVAVWVGNASGEGRPDLTGLSYAGPVLFRILQFLPATTWFKEPGGMASLRVCKQSGFRAGANCDGVYWQKSSAKGLEAATCPYHQKIFLDQSQRFVVNSNCYPVDLMSSKNCFVLPPLQAFYYKYRSTDYKELPPNYPGCFEEKNTVNIVYPLNGAKVFVPRNLSGEHEELIFEAVHNRKNSVVHWHLDGNYLSTTTGVHRISLRPSIGKHKLTVVDEFGNEDSAVFDSSEK